MRATWSGVPSTSGRAMLWLALLVVGGGLGGVWFVMQSGEGRRTGQNSVPVPEEANARGREPDAAPSASRLATPVTTDAETATPGRGNVSVEATPRAFEDARPTPAATGRDEEMLRKMRELMRGERDQRLALAREILAADNAGVAAIRAFEVLIELAPEEAAAFLRENPAGKAGDPQGLRITGSMIERLSGKGVLNDEDLRVLYESGGSDVRMATATALEERGDRSLMESYLARQRETLKSDNPQQRMLAARELSMMRTATATDMIVGLLKDENEDVRMQAIRSLARNPRETRSMDALRPLLQDPSERVRNAAKRTIQMLERVQSARDRNGSGSRR